MWALLEPSGLLDEGDRAPASSGAWLTVLCARLSVARGREIYAAEW